MIIPQFNSKTGLTSAVAALFSAGEQGAWYEPSLTNGTLFQDAAGTTPVTAVEQPVSLMLDKSKGGVGTNGAKRVNLINYTEQFDNAYWTKDGEGGTVRVVVTANAETAPNATSTADKIAEANNTNFHNIGLISPYITVASSTSYVFKVYAKEAGRRYVQICFGTGQVSGNPRANFDLTDGVLGTVDGGITASITSAGSGWYLLSTTITTATTAITPIINLITSSTQARFQSYTGNGTDGIYAWGADLRLASEVNTLPTYQRITDTWYNTQAGNHAYTPSTATASRPVLSARVNLLTKTEEFDDAVWTKGNILAFGSGSVANTNATTDPLGGNTADLIVENTSANALHQVNQTFSSTNGVSYTASVYAKAANRQYLQITFGGGEFGSTQYATFDLTNGTVSGSAAGTASITSVGNSWYRLVFTASATASSATATVLFVLSNASTGRAPTYTGDGTSGVYIWGADLRVANDGVGIPSYQRVNTSTDYDTVGFPMYLRFDGSDDYMLTNSVDFSGTDKMTVWAGVRKLSDTAMGMIYNNEAASSAGFYIAGPGANGATNYNFRCYTNGDVNSTIGTYTAPISNTLQISLDVALNGSAEIAAKVNGSNVSLSYSSSANNTGNFGNVATYLGHRYNNTLRFNGRIYSMIIRGASSSAEQIAQAETYVNSKTRAY